MPNQLEQTRKEMLEERPHIDSLPFLKWIRARFFARESQLTISGHDGDGLISYSWSQSAIIVEVDGKEYIKRWGCLWP